MNQPKVWPQAQIVPTEYDPEGGLTKREFFAAMAMQGYLSNPSCVLNAAQITKASANMADRLIDALNAEGDE